MWPNSIQIMNAYKSCYFQNQSLLKFYLCNERNGQFLNYFLKLKNQLSYT